MGWNRVSHGGALRLFDGIPDGAHFYFVHSYYPEAAEFTGGARGPLAFAWCDYGVRFPAAMEWGLIAATQFHPEKSQRWGIRLLENFAALVRERAVRAVGHRGAGVPAVRGEPVTARRGMIVIPAVDVREGRCVRLRQGRADAETVFGDDPVAMAERWAALGARRLHVVDLDGAFAGAPRQTALIEKIVDAVRPVPGLGRRWPARRAAIETILDAGARWVVVGTRAAVDPAVPPPRCAAAVPDGSSWPSTRGATAWRSRDGRRPAS